MLEAFLEQEPQYIALCISETWLTSEKLDTLNISRFQIASSYSRANRKGGGVCILLREDIEYKEEYAITEMSVEYIIEACASSSIYVHSLQSEASHFQQMERSWFSLVDGSMVPCDLSCYGLSVNITCAIKVVISGQPLKCKFTGAHIEKNHSQGRSLKTIKES
ncbi:hypothetical protein ACJJTC_002309 [Scirpophaga incertulas]